MLTPYRTETFNAQLKALRNNQAVVARIFRLIADACEHPFSGLGKPEPLKYGKAGLWSRRIDKKNRLIYKVVKPDLILFSCIGHYD
ncbi:MAG TPA: Txe/YoeB family addiction module toxin [Kiritimatiellia bacterium]|jgi:toxin YoeB|nr:Txe/YoeB family addiction module toxin [Kiritimatiellia bacterium]